MTRYQTDTQTVVLDNREFVRNHPEWNGVAFVSEEDQNYVYFIRLISLPDGRTRAIGYAADITELKERTAQLQQASRLAVLGEMAAGMAHELRQPLSGISFAAQNAEYALDRNDIAKTRQRLSRIVQQTERASHIIEHLREFARGADAKASPVPVACTISSSPTRR